LTQNYKNVISSGLKINGRLVIRRNLLIIAVVFALSGCKSSGSPSAAQDKAKIYQLADVDREMKEAGVGLQSSRDDLRAFFKSHPNYQVCQDTDYMLVARMRNSKIDPHASDQYIVAAYQPDGKISNLEVGPPEFSVANLPSYCH